eukprot:1160514-Pelagomonas_calceolata.AAC.15
MSSGLRKEDGECHVFRVILICYDTIESEGVARSVRAHSDAMKRMRVIWCGANPDIVVQAGTPFNESCQQIGKLYGQVLARNCHRCTDEEHTHTP